MLDAAALSGWDTAIFVVPIAGLMVLGMFGQGEVLAKGRAPRARKSRFCELRGDGSLVMRDPDGRRSEKAPETPPRTVIVGEICAGSLAYESGEGETLEMSNAESLNPINYL